MVRECTLISTEAYENLTITFGAKIRKEARCHTKNWGKNKQARIRHPKSAGFAGHEHTHNRFPRA